MAYKVIKWLIIPFFAVFLMSQNASAVEGVFNIDDYSLSYFTNHSTVSCSYNGSTFSTQGYTCQLNGNNSTLAAIRFPAQNYKEGDIVQFDVITSYIWSDSITGNTFSGYYINPFIVPMVTNSQFIDNIDVEELYHNDRDRLVNYYLQYSCSPRGTGTDCSGYPEVAIENVSLQAFRFTFRVLSDLSNYEFTVYGRGSNLFNLTGFNIGNNSADLIFARYHIYNKIETDEEKVARKDLEGTQNIENQNTSDTPGGDNESATNLIGNISGIFNQIKNIPVGSSCNIDANFGNLDLGNLNLCTGKENMPFIVNFGATVFQLVFVVSTGLILVRQVLSLYDWSRK